MIAPVARLRLALAQRRRRRDAAVIKQRMETRGGSSNVAAGIGAWGGTSAGSGCDGGSSTC